MLSLPAIFPDALGAYSLDRVAKTAYLLPKLSALTREHYGKCAPFRAVVDRLFGGLPPGDYARLEDLPFLPVRMFKTRSLCSVDPAAVFKVVSSSGTTGQQVSRVCLDRMTADLQARALVKIMQHFLGKERLPMVVLDCPGVVPAPESFSARGAGVLGLLQFGRQPVYALRDDMSLDEEALRVYLEASAGRRVLFFGFTSLVWQHVIAELRRRGRALPANEGILLHSGGWKKMESAKVGGPEFRQAARETLGVREVRNFYGMAEQLGSVFCENNLHWLHAPVFADVIIRDPATLAPLPVGATGLIQTLSVLPRSYPGHSLLSEDLGRIVGGDDPAAGMPGAFFEVAGRAPHSEIRGCSDTYEPTP